MRYNVVLTAAAAEDFRHLDGSLKKPVAKQLRKLETSPRLGDHLDNRAGLDLTGYYKLYVAKQAVRIVYRIIEQDIVVEVVAIGKREDLGVYREALSRPAVRPSLRDWLVLFNSVLIRSTPCESWNLKDCRCQERNR